MKNKLKLKKLGNTALQVSEIGLGCWQLGGEVNINDVSTNYGNVTKTDATKIIEYALESGVNTFDTADVYSLGESERRIGNVLKEFRSEINLFTKAGSVPTFSDTTLFESDLSPSHLYAALCRSLKRLNTDYVDLFQIHRVPQINNDFENIRNAFTKIKSENLSRYCGASVGYDYVAGKSFIEYDLVDSLQIHFSLLHFNAIKELFALAKKNNIGIIVSQPLSQGFLTGKYDKNIVFPKNDIRRRLSQNQIKEFITKVNEFKILENEKRNLTQIALSYVLSFDLVSTCIPGSKSVQQLKTNIDSSFIKLSKNDLNLIQKIQDNW